MEFDSDGVRLNYELHGPEAGPPVVLVHGFASDYKLNWLGTRWQESLTGAGYRVIGLDCRGHGRSDKPHDPAAYAIDVMAADVRRLLDELGVPSAHYTGYSMGARIGLQSVLGSTTWRLWPRASKAWGEVPSSTPRGSLRSARRSCWWRESVTRSRATRPRSLARFLLRSWSSFPAATTWAPCPPANSRRRLWSSWPKLTLAGPSPPPEPNRPSARIQPRARGDANPGC